MYWHSYSFAAGQHCDVSTMAAMRHYKNVFIITDVLTEWVGIV